MQRGLLEPLEPLSPVTNPKRNALARSSMDFTSSAFLSANAKQKFEKGFNATYNGGSFHGIPEDNWDDNRQPNNASTRSGNKHVPPPRCNSVLGLRSSDREVDGNLRQSAESKLALDYVDLECLLQDKMREIGVQMPKFKHGRKQNGGMDRAITPDLERSSSRLAAENIRVAAQEAEEYAKRVREAAFLFRLCQQEIKLQIQLHCPERARLTESTLEFYSAVLDCLVKPLDQTRAELTELKTQRGDDLAWQASTLADIRMFVKQCGDGLRSEGWQRAGHTSAPSEAQEMANNPETTFQASVEHLSSITGAAVACIPLLHQDIVGLQESTVPKADLQAANAQIQTLTKRVSELEGLLASNSSEYAATLAKITSERDAMTIKYEDTQKLKDETERQRQTLESNVIELKDQLRISNETVSKLNDAVSSRDEEIQQLKDALAKTTQDLQVTQGKLSEMTKDGVQLTPRPHWSDRCSGKASGNTTTERVENACAAWSAEEDKGVALSAELSATQTKLLDSQTECSKEKAMKEKVEEELTDLCAELQRLKNPSIADASCGCPELRDGFELIPLSEYLEQYLSKRFGLQGHMSSWEVEKMGKDIGWVMEAQVGLRSSDY